MSALDLALAFTLPEEGGYVDDPADAGGATNHGITQAVYDAWRDAQKQPHRGVGLITDAETRAIYTEMYWQTGKCDQLPGSVAIAHFDWCVNHGVTGAIRTLQQALWVPVDGIFGPTTRTAANTTNPKKTITRYLTLRRTWYLARVKARPDQARFLAGWLGRVDRLQAYLEGLA